MVKTTLGPDLSKFKYKIPDPESTQAPLAFVRSVLFSILLIWFIYSIKSISLRIVQFFRLLWNGWSPNQALLMIFIEMLDPEPIISEDEPLLQALNENIASNTFATIDQSRPLTSELSLDESFYPSSTPESSKPKTSNNDTSDETLTENVQPPSTDAIKPPGQSQSVPLANTPLLARLDSRQKLIESTVQKLENNLAKLKETFSHEVVNQHRKQSPAEIKKDLEKLQLARTQLECKQKQRKKQERQNDEDVQRISLSQTKQKNYSILDRERHVSTSPQQRSTKKVKISHDDTGQREVDQEQYKKERIKRIQLQLRETRLQQEQAKQEPKKQQQQTSPSQESHQNQLQTTNLDGTSRKDLPDTAELKQQKDTDSLQINRKISKEHRHVSFKSIYTDTTEQSLPAIQVSQSNTYSNRNGREATFFADDQSQKKSVFLDQSNKSHDKGFIGASTDSKNHIHSSVKESPSIKKDNQVRNSGSQPSERETHPAKPPELDLKKLKQTFSQELFVDDQEKAAKINAALDAVTSYQAK